jgi:plastocyanin
MALVGFLSLSIYLGSALSQTTVTSYVAVDPTSTYYQGTTHTIAVGKGGHTFIPDVTQANVGDIIEFDFYPLNHSVVRAEYGIPCVPYEMTGPKVGFFSGFMPVDAILSDPPKWTVRINDTDPIFYYCSALGSCLDHEMVGVSSTSSCRIFQSC